MKSEGLQTEFKREYVEDFKKSVIAFANSDGGELFFGIEDDGSVCGIQDTDETMLKITNAIRDSISPDITLFTKCESLLSDGKSYIRLTVQCGTSRPYYLKSKGIRPEGVFIRQGASSVPASESAILSMIKEASGFVYENERSLTQELTFSLAEAQFASRNIDFGDSQKKSLGIIGSDGTFSNLGLLLSDQCPHIIKAAIFQGSSKTRPRTVSFPRTGSRGDRPAQRLCGGTAHGTGQDPCQPDAAHGVAERHCQPDGCRHAPAPDRPYGLRQRQGKRPDLPRLRLAPDVQPGQCRAHA